MTQPTASNPFASELRRLAPVVPSTIVELADRVTDEYELRAALLLAAVSGTDIDRAVRRAFAWSTLSPLERAIADLLVIETMTAEQILHVLPETVRPTGPRRLAELHAALATLCRRGLVGSVAADEGG
jgi:hypothetical protein